MTDPVDLRAPMSDPAHEALRVGLCEALDAVTVLAQRVEGAMVLLLSTTDFAQSTLNTARAARDTLAGVETRMEQLAAGGVALQTAVADLHARVAALGAPAASPEPPDPEA